jgi:hypothetical protein
MPLPELVEGNSEWQRVGFDELSQRFTLPELVEGNGNWSSDTIEPW